MTFGMTESLMSGATYGPLSNPPAFCNSSDRILGTFDFYRMPMNASENVNGDVLGEVSLNGAPLTFLISSPKKIYPNFVDSKYAVQSRF